MPIRVIAYCWMTYHFRLEFRPRGDGDLSRCMPLLNCPNLPEVDCKPE